MIFHHSKTESSNLRLFLMIDNWLAASHTVLPKQAVEKYLAKHWSHENSFHYILTSICMNHWNAKFGAKTKMSQLCSDCSISIKFEFLTQQMLYITWNTNYNVAANKRDIFNGCFYLNSSCLACHRWQLTYVGHD